MPCPFFFATKPLWGIGHPQMPLGELYEGECRAAPDGYRPGPEELRNLCNLGYARKSCPRFPAEAGPDAVRFSVAQDSEDTVLIRYVEERGHRPWDHGWLEYHVAEHKFVAAHANPLLNRLAEAYAEAYLRRRTGIPARPAPLKA